MIEFPATETFLQVDSYPLPRLQSKVSGDLVRNIAAYCHSADKVFMAELGYDITPWGELSVVAKVAVVSGVLFFLNNPLATPADSHAVWVKAKEALGWRYGQDYDSARMLNPELVAFSALSLNRQRRAQLFKDTIALFLNSIGPELYLGVLVH